MLSRSLPFLVAALAACGTPASAPDLGADPIRINTIPTGSIQTPSLCERVAVDKRVTFTGAEGFSFLWTGDGYELVYADLTERDIFVARLSRDGVLVDGPFRLERTAPPSQLPTVVRTASGFVVAWQELGDTPTVRVHALDALGRPAGVGKQVATARSTQMRPVLASSPYGIAISWMDQTPASSTVLTELGDSTAYIGLLDEHLDLRTDPPPQQIGPSARAGYPWLAGNGAQLAVLWSGDPSGQTDTYFSSVGSTLSMQGPINVRDLGASRAALLGRLLLTDFGYLAAWEDHRDGEEEIYMAMLDPSGNRYAGGLVEEPATGSANWPHLAWTGSAAGIVYYQFRAGRPQVFMTFIDEAGARIGGGADMQLSDSPEWARFPDVIWNGDEFAVLWVDARDGHTELYFNRAVCRKPAPV